MKTLIVYASLTGNTKRIAEGLAAVLSPCDLCPIEEAPDPASLAGYAFVAVGYWVDRGMPDAKTKRYLASLQHTRVALFGTLGAWPDSEHAKQCMAAGEALVSSPERGNTVLGSWLCQGKVDPKVIAFMQKKAGSVHPMTAERMARLEEANQHPNEEDIAKAQAFFSNIAQGLAQTS